MMPIFLAAENPLDEVLPHTYFHVLGFPISTTIIMATVAGALMLMIFPRLVNRPDSSAPTGAKNFFESILEYLRIEVFRPALKENTDRFLPFLWTLFFFILFCNVMACIPFAAFFELITLGHVTHLGGAATGTISTTAALAVAAFFFIHGQGIDQIARSLMDGTYGHHGHGETHGHDDGHDRGHGREPASQLEHFRGEALASNVSGDFRALTNPTAHYGDEHRGSARHEMLAYQSVHEQGEQMTPLKALLLAFPIYLWNFAPHPFRPQPGEPQTKWLMDVPMWAFLLLLELIGAVIKPFALCLRLFANMVAGHVLLAVLISLIVAVPFGLAQLAIGVPVSILDIGIQLLEIFVAFLQAYIFTFLVTLFLASAVAPEH
jgi:F0F1-type ATP synthase membrane subunit a